MFFRTLAVRTKYFISEADPQMNGTRYWTNSGNYCIFYDIDEQKIMATPLYEMRDVYLIKQRFKPSEKLIERLQVYFDECDFDTVISVEGE